MSRPKPVFLCSVCGAELPDTGVSKRVEFLEYDQEIDEYVTDELLDVCPKCWESIVFLFGGGEEE